MTQGLTVCNTPCDCISVFFLLAPSPENNRLGFVLYGCEVGKANVSVAKASGTTATPSICVTDGAAEDAAVAKQITFLNQP